MEDDGDNHNYNIWENTILDIKRNYIGENHCFKL